MACSVWLTVQLCTRGGFPFWYSKANKAYKRIPDSLYGILQWFVNTGYPPLLFRPIRFEICWLWTCARDLEENVFMCQGVVFKREIGKKKRRCSFVLIYKTCINHFCPFCFSFHLFFTIAICGPQSIATVFYKIFSNLSLMSTALLFVDI